MRWRRDPLVLVLVVCLVAATCPVAAQTTAQFPVQFDFLNPGARSLAMGGAFVGAADDATAAFTNPAGLAFIARLEVSVEGRYWTLDTPFLAGGRISGAATGTGLDTTGSPVYLVDRDEQLRPTFLSVMFPVGPKSTITAFRHELTSVENAFFSQGVFSRGSFGGITDDASREIPIGGTRSARIVNYGASMGFRLTDRIAIGGSVALSRLRLDAGFTRFGFETSIFSPADTTITRATATQASDDSSMGGSVGALYRVRERLSVGVTYRRGPRFRFTQRDEIVITGARLDRTGRFKVPDVVGAGVSWLAVDRTSGRLAVLLDYDRVAHSQLKRDFVTFQSIASGRAAQLRIDDANEVHVGSEFQLLQFRGKDLPHPVAVRAGA